MSSISLPRLSTFLKTAGPGLVAMPADTDAGSFVTAAQSGVGRGCCRLRRAS